MRWSDLTRSILFPLALPALVSLLWFAAWASAFAADAERSFVPAFQNDGSHSSADADAPPARATNAPEYEAVIASGQE